MPIQPSTLLPTRQVITKQIVRLRLSPPEYPVQGHQTASTLSKFQHPEAHQASFAAGLTGTAVELLKLQNEPVLRSRVGRLKSRLSTGRSPLTQYSQQPGYVCEPPTTPQESNLLLEDLTLERLRITKSKAPHLFAPQSSTSRWGH